MHVLHLTIPVEHACGISRHVVLLTTEQLKRHRVTIATPGGGATEELDRAGIPWIRVPIGPANKTPWEFVRAVVELIRFVKRERVTVLHAHHRYPALLARVVSGLVPSVHTVATCHYLAMDHRRFSYPVERVIAVSDATRRHLVERYRIRPSNVVVVPNALRPLREDDRSVFPPESLKVIPGDRLVVMGAGRLEPTKGYRTLVEAIGAARVREFRPVLVLVGDGPERWRLEDMASTLGLELLITGIVPTVTPYLRRADLFVHPSETETFGLVVAEAGLAGCPVVCTNVGGLPELVVDGETGLLVPPNDPGALAHAITELLGDPSWRGQLGAALRRSLADRARPDRMADATEQVYLSVATDA